MKTESEDKQLRQLFQSKFENDIQTPPPTSWKAIKKDLPLKKAPFIGTKIWLSSLIGVVAVSVTLNYLLNTDKENEQNTTSKIETIDSKEITDTKEIDKSIIEKSTTSQGKGQDSKIEDESNKEAIASKSSVDVKNELTKNDPGVIKTQLIVQNNLKAIKQKESKAEKQVASNSEKRSTNEKNASSRKLEEPGDQLSKTIPLSNEQLKSGISEGVAAIENSETNKKTALEKNKIESVAKHDKITNTQQYINDVSGFNPTDSKKKIEENSSNEQVSNDTILPLVEIEDTRFVNHVADKTLVLFPPMASASVATPSRFSLEIYSGLGRNIRRVRSDFDAENITNKDLDGKRVKLRNKFIGVSTTYEISKYFAVQGGILIGSNRFRSRIFEKEVIQEADNSNYQFKTADGNMDLDREELTSYYTESDTTLLRMRINYRSTYVSIPIVFKISLPGNIIVPYFKFGGSWDKALRSKSTLTVLNDNTTYKLRRSVSERASSFQSIVGFGFATNFKSGINFFLEPNFSLPLTNFNRASNLRVSSRFTQLKAGISIRL